MKLHVLYNTPCTIELVMHIQTSWMKNIQRLLLTPRVRATTESNRRSQRRTGEARALLYITLSKWGLHTQKLAVKGGWSSWELEREGGWGLSRYDLKQLFWFFFFISLFLPDVGHLNAAVISTLPYEKVRRGNNEKKNKQKKTRDPTIPVKNLHSKSGRVHPRHVLFFSLRVHTICAQENFCF